MVRGSLCGFVGELRWDRRVNSWGEGLAGGGFDRGKKGVERFFGVIIGVFGL